MKKTIPTSWWILPLLLFTSYSAFSQATYVWNGLTNNQWTTSANWTPARVAPLSTDILLFNVARSAIISDVPAQTVGSLIVTNNTSVELQASAPINFSVTTLLEVNTGSFIGFSSNGNAINVTTAGITNMHGTITMHSGNFAVNGSLTLQGALTKVTGKYLLGPTSSLNLGSGGTSPNIQLPDDVFALPLSIANLTINNANGASLGNQSITVTNSINLISGVLNTNSSGRVILTSPSIAPLESSTSYIKGYVELLPTAVGTGSLGFMGLNIAPGADNLGNVTVVRKTGAVGANYFSGKQSIAVNWKITADNQPVSGRNLNLSWISANDNSHDASLRFQIYRFGASSFWQAVGALAPLASNVAGVRTTATVTTTEFSEWTASDENSPLPVQWLDFYGAANEREIAMTWKTAMEENTDFFEVEKMNQDNKFFPVGKLRAAGNSKSVRRYNFVDYEPSAGVNYYRVKQVDVDGKYSYSKVINVPFHTEMKSAYSVYPIPAQAFVNVKRNLKFDENETLVLYDQFGKIVLAQALNKEEVTRLDNLQIPAGLYRLEIRGVTSNYNQKLIIK